MAKFKKEDFVFYSPHARNSDGTKDKLIFNTDILINKKGEFYILLPSEAEEFFERSNVEIDGRSRTGRRKSKITSSTYDGLKSRVKELAMLAFSREEVSKELIIRYNIQTTASYLLDENNEVVPNGYFVKGFGSEGKQWRNGTVGDTGGREPFGFLFYVQVFYKVDYLYASGVSKVEYEPARDNDAEEGTALHYLASIRGMQSPGRSKDQEVPYSDSVAQFFINTYKGICMLNEKIKGFTDPESILAMIENNQKMIG